MNGKMTATVLFAMALAMVAMAGLAIMQTQVRIVVLERVVQAERVQALETEVRLTKQLAEQRQITRTIAEKHDKLLAAVMSIYKEIQETMQYQGKLNELFKALFYGSKA